MSSLPRKPPSEAFFEAYLNPDGDDYGPDGKFYTYRSLLRTVRKDDIPEEVKLRQIKHLKDEVFPFWHRCDELYNQESAELMEVFQKYNGPQGIRTRYDEEYNEIKARIAASGDTVLLNDMKGHVVYHRPAGDLSFSYSRGSITYKFKAEDEAKGKSGDGQLDQADLPVINLVPLGAGDGIPHHHNMNPDDDLSLNPTLLQLLQRLMDHKYAESFINFDDEKRLPMYYVHVRKPRWFRLIEQGLTSDPSLGYGATAFFNDMLLLFCGPELYYPPGSEPIACATVLRGYMEKLLREMGSVGEQLLAKYNAIVAQGMETWPDPELLYFHQPYHPRFPGYEGEKPDLNAVKALAWDQLKWGQERVQQLRSRLASTASITGQSGNKPALEGETHLDHEPRKRPREESGESAEDNPARGSKRQRSLHSASPDPSDPDTASPQRAAGKRLRAPTDNGGDDGDEEAEEGRATKRQRLSKFMASYNVPDVGSGAVASGSHTVPPQGTGSKRARAPADDESESDDQEETGDGHGPSAKRQRLTKDTHSVGLPAESPEAGPVTASKATSEPAILVSGRSQGHASSLAGQSASQEFQIPAHYEAPSSQPLKFSRNTITMSKVSKMGKTRPWLFGYNTDEGYGIYAFVKCPGPNCKHHFTSHPLQDHRARDHILSCNQLIQDEQDMVRQYACQVVKDAGRKSDLTVDWARKSNLNLLPSNLKNNHPENFPLSPADG